MTYLTMSRTMCYKFIFQHFSDSVLCIYSDLWRKENTVQHSLSSLKEELAKSDQALRSMAGKVIHIFLSKLFDVI